MNGINVFYIDGKKHLIFRKEEDYFISYDPLSLEFIKINQIGSEMLYLISEKYKFNDILQHFIDKYNVDRETIYKDLIEFLKSYRSLGIICDILVDLEFPTGVIADAV